MKQFLSDEIQSKLVGGICLDRTNGQWGKILKISVDDNRVLIYLQGYAYQKGSIYTLTVTPKIHLFYHEHDNKDVQVTCTNFEDQRFCIQGLNGGDLLLSVTGGNQKLEAVWDQLMKDYESYI